MLQFLVEVVVMTATGGIIGILLGIGSSELLKKWAQWPTLIDPTIVAVAFLFSGAEGGEFGSHRSAALRIAAGVPFVCLCRNEVDRDDRVGLRRAGELYQPDLKGPNV